MQAKWPAVASKIIGNFTGSISGKGEKIELDDAFGNPVNAVNFAEGGNWPAAANGGGSSLELRDPRSDNSQPGAWAASNESVLRGYALAELHIRFQACASELQQRSHPVE